MFAAGNAAAATAATYIEDVFSTWLYTGDLSYADQTLTTGINLSTYGGMIWSKRRSAAENHFLQDTNRGLGSRISSNTTGAAATGTSWPMNAISTTGMTVSGSDYTGAGETYVSWTFRKQPKFFDVVTYTGDGTSSKTINHSLGSTPGCIIIKPIDSATFNDWRVWHRSLTSQSYQLTLNTTAAEANVGNFISQNSTTFTVGYTGANQSGINYVAYLFAHNAGGFGLTGTDNVISCGSFTTDGGGSAVVDLGYEPQFLLTKESSTTGNWDMFDSMRGFTVMGQSDALLRANLANAETNAAQAYPTATGFGIENKTPSATFIYIAIRRGPMKTPTSGTSVFQPVTYAGDGNANRVVSYSITPDSVLSGSRTVEFVDNWASRLTGKSALITQYTDAESANRISGFDVQNGLKVGNYSNWNASGRNYINWVFVRAPGFFDEVCYTGTGANRTVTHNLGVAPELMIVKKRSSTSTWFVYCNYIDQPNQAYYWLGLNSTSAADFYSGAWNATNPTSTVFTVGTDSDVNASGSTFVAYLFASCPGVSKVGSYTGTGSTLQINCGFTGGARFVLIKRTDSTGNWYVWDSARGIVSGDDPYLLLNSVAEEVTNTDWVDAYSAGFELSANTSGNYVNVSGWSYIFLAIA